MAFVNLAGFSIHFERYRLALKCLPPACTLPQQRFSASAHEDKAQGFDEWAVLSGSVVTTKPRLLFSNGESRRMRGTSTNIVD